MNRVQTKTGDLVYVNECKENDVTFGFISVHLKHRYSSLNEAEKVLVEFMQQLQPTFAVQYTTGPHFEPQPDASKIALVDYWQDVEKRDWKVKGWTNGAIIAVFYVRNIGSVSVGRETFFLNSVEFAGL